MTVAAATKGKGQRCGVVSCITIGGMGFDGSILA